MTAQDAYRWLIGASAPPSTTSLISTSWRRYFALSLADARPGGSTVLDGIGLEKPALMELVAELFPGARAAIESEAGDLRVSVDDEEQSIRDILGMYCDGRQSAGTAARRDDRPPV